VSNGVQAQESRDERETEKRERKREREREEREERRERREMRERVLPSTDRKAETHKKRGGGTPLHKVATALKLYVRIQTRVEQWEPTTGIAG
jgi:hypothetical protein